MRSKSQTWHDWVVYKHNVHLWTGGCVKSLRSPSWTVTQSAHVRLSVHTRARSLNKCNQFSQIHSDIQRSVPILRKTTKPSLACWALMSIQVEFLNLRAHLWFRKHNCQQMIWITNCLLIMPCPILHMHFHFNFIIMFYFLTRYCTVYMHVLYTLHVHMNTHTRLHAHPLTQCANEYSKVL